MAYVVSLSSRQACGTASCHLDGQPSCLRIGYERRCCPRGQSGTPAGWPAGWPGLMNLEGEGSEGCALDRQAGWAQLDYVARSKLSALGTTEHLF